jgi:hypothetical protein
MKESGKLIADMLWKYAPGAVVASLTHRLDALETNKETIDG